jgi:hypothetical protein
MSKESKAILNEFHVVIEEVVKDTVDDLLIKREINTPLINLSKDESKDLESLSLTQAQIDVLRKGMIALGQSIVFNILCIIDGVYDAKNEIPDLAIVDRTTNKNIADQFLHDEFLGLLKNQT